MSPSINFIDYYLKLNRVLKVSSHRATSIPPTARMQRLEAFIAPVKQLWQNPELDEALSSFNGFCELLGIGKVRNYLVSHRVHEVSDWSTMQLDNEGQVIQAELNERVKVMYSLRVLTRTRSTDCTLQALPLRPTKSFLGCSTERVEKDSAPYEVSCTLWHDAVPIILPDLLKFLR